MKESEKLLKTLKSIDGTLKRIEQLFKTQNQNKEPKEAMHCGLCENKYKSECGESALSGI